eukprot:9262038-Pyramimonas_sp.AAC.1
MSRPSWPSDDSVSVSVPESSDWPASLAPHRVVSCWVGVAAERVASAVIGCAHWPVACAVGPGGGCELRSAVVSVEVSPQMIPAGSGAVAGSAAVWNVRWAASPRPRPITWPMLPGARSARWPKLRI